MPSDVEYTNGTWPEVERDHASVIGNYLDRDVGRITSLIDELDLAENTIIFFASDNGAHNEVGRSGHSNCCLIRCTCALYLLCFILMQTEPFLLCVRF